MKKQNIVQSFNSAIEGFIYVLKTQRNMRLHFLLAILALLLGIYLNLERLEILILLGTICFVLLAEMLNTAIEMSVNLVSDSFNPLARIIKDIAAACVLVASLNAVIVGYLLFLGRPWGVYIENGIDKIRSSSWHITLIILILVMFFVILGKAFFHRGTPLRGGMPSGHAAVAFAIWAVISFFTADHVVTILVFILAFLVARSRLSNKIHNLWEITAGGLLGALIPTLVFQILGGS